LREIAAAFLKDAPNQDDFNTKLTQFKTDNKDKKP